MDYNPLERSLLRLNTQIPALRTGGIVAFVPVRCYTLAVIRRRQPENN